MFSVLRAASPNLFPIFPRTSFTESMVSAETHQGHEIRKKHEPSSNRKQTGPDLGCMQGRGSQGRTPGRWHGAGGGAGDVGVAGVGRRGVGGRGMVRGRRRRGHVLRREPRVGPWRRGLVSSGGGGRRMHVAGGEMGPARRRITAGRPLGSLFDSWWTLGAAWSARWVGLSLFFSFRGV